MTDRDMAKDVGMRASPSTARDGGGQALVAALVRQAGPGMPGSRTRLLIVPDGGLTRLPFEVLPTADGRRVIRRLSLSAT